METELKVRKLLEELQAKINLIFNLLNKRKIDNKNNFY